MGLLVPPRQSIAAEMQYHTWFFLIHPLSHPSAIKRVKTRLVPIPKLRTRHRPCPEAC